jgi:hypothetical protein
VYQKRQLSKAGILRTDEQGDLKRFEVTEGDDIEEDAAYERLDGEEVSAFNMRDEEAEGYDSTTGELRRGKTADDDVEKDPWLLSIQKEDVCTRYLALLVLTMRA